MPSKSKAKLHAVTKNTHTPDVHYLDVTEAGQETNDTPAAAEKARLEGIKQGQRTRTSTARFSEADLKNLLDPKIHGEVRAVGEHD